MAQQFIALLFILMAIAVLVLIGVFFYFLKVWIRAAMSGARVSLFNLLGMKLRRVPPTLIVDARIRLVKAGLDLDTDAAEPTTSPAVMSSMSSKRSSPPAGQHRSSPSSAVRPSISPAATSTMPSAPA